MRAIVIIRNTRVRNGAFVQTKIASRNAPPVCTNSALNIFIFFLNDLAVLPNALGPNENYTKRTSALPNSTHLSDGVQNKFL